MIYILLHLQIIFLRYFDIQINYTVKSGSTVVETGTSTIALKGFNIADGLSVGSITLNQSNITF